MVGSAATAIVVVMAKGKGKGKGGAKGGSSGANKMRLERVSSNRMSSFAVVLEIFEVAPSLFMVDVRKVASDTLEYHKFYKNLCNKLDSIIWIPTEVFQRLAATPSSTM